MISDALNAIDADATALATASILAEEALALHHDAAALLAEGWSSQSGCAATDLLRRQIVDGTELVAALHDAAAEFRSLRGVVEESGSVPDMGQTAARLNDRPTPSLQAPAPQPSYAGPAAWPSSAPSLPLPDLAGALVGLVATAADALSPDSVDPPVEKPGSPKDANSDEKAGPPPRATVVDEPAPPPGPPPAAAVPPTASQAVPAIPALPDSPQPQPQPRTEPPLLQAELPPEPDPAPAPESTPVAPQSPAEPGPPQRPAEPAVDTPCEIAADELPQVGQ